MRTPQMSPTLPGAVSVTKGEHYLYSTGSPLEPCGHSPLAIVFFWNDSKPAGCGICHLRAIFQTEFPKRLHEYEVLAENGNPETSPRFWAHVESSMGLVPPKPGQPLKSFRASRARAYRRPSRQQFPVTAALWEMMGYQPKLAKPLIKALFGATAEEIGQEFTLSTYMVHSTLAKGVRYALRHMRH